MALSPAVFLDKDGTLVENVPYNVDPARIELAAGAGNALRRLRRSGFKLLVVSNQAGVAEGRFSEQALVQVHARLRELLARRGAALDGFYYCPHATNAGCRCRKPRPGLLLRAARRHRVDLARSWMFGDILDDIEAGHRAGCRAVLIDAGNETQWRAGPMRRPDYRVRSLREAATAVGAAPALERSGGRRRLPTARIERDGRATAGPVPRGPRFAGAPRR